MVCVAKIRLQFRALYFSDVGGWVGRLGLARASDEAAPSSEQNQLFTGMAALSFPQSTALEKFATPENPKTWQPPQPPQSPDRLFSSVTSLSPWTEHPQPLPATKTSESHGCCTRHRRT